MVQNDIGHEQYGVYSALFSLSFLFVSFSDFGVNYYITQKLAVDQGQLKTLFSNVFSFKIFLVIIYPIIVGGTGWLLGYSHTELYFLFFLSFTQALLQFVYFFRANFQASQYFPVDSFVSVIDKVLLIAIVLILMSYGLTLKGFIYGKLLSVIFTFAITYGLALYFYGWIRPAFDMHTIKQIIRYSWPFALITVLYSINEKIDQVMLERIYGAKEAGLYAAAYRWLDASMMYLWTVMPIFFAKFSFNVKSKEEIQKLFNSGLIICSLPFVFMFCFVLFYGDKLFIFFSNSSSVEISVMTSTLRILFFSALLSGFFSLFGTLLNSSGFIKQMSLAVAISIVLNVVLNFIFIPLYGAIAAAMTTGASAVFLSIASVVLVVRNNLININYQLCAKLFLISTLTGLFFFLLEFLKLDWIAVSIGAGMVMGSFMLILKLNKYLV
jgi:O-antigen/teichoic acid export membrane protein